MIHSVKSNNVLFKPVEFHSGFNVILADRDNRTDDKHTRNGAGKTTLIEIIHFCLGAQVPKNSVFKNENLKGWSFIIEVDIGKSIYQLERFTDSNGKIYIDGDVTALNFELQYDQDAHRYYATPSVFNKGMLGEWYGIGEKDDEKQVPSFRELISYAVRRNVEGYKNAFEFFSSQKTYSVQACNAYFLNLSLEYVRQFQELKEKKKEIDTYVNVSKSGVIGSFSLNIGELSTEVFSLQKTVDSLKEQLETFQVHPQYEDIAKQANILTDLIHQHTNTLVFRQYLLAHYESSLNEEISDVSVDDIQAVYSEAGIILKDAALRPLSEVLDFHKSIISNRREYLQNEISTLKREIFEVNAQIEEVSRQRAALMSILETHGALQEYILIQDRYAIAKQKLEDAKKRLDAAEYIEDSKSRIKIQNQELLIKSRQDYNERIHAREQAVSLFKENTEFLYPEAGTLTIDLNENGYSFGMEIKSSRSQGVNYMKVFCYDMVLEELGIQRKHYPDFLVHDSTIFDGVDERQIARALILAWQKSHDLGFQYICMVNSDMIPYQEFDDEFSDQFADSIVLRISDNQENGGLLGIRF